jgi:alpha-L-rhamnosidase
MSLHSKTKSRLTANLCFTAIVLAGFSASAQQEAGLLSSEAAQLEDSPWVCPGEYSVERERLVFSFVQPVEFVEKAPGHYFIDFGRAAFGSISLADAKILEELSVDDYPMEIEIHLGEKRGEDDTVDRVPGGTIRYRQVLYEREEPPESPGPLGRYGGIIPAIKSDERNTGAAAILMPKGDEVLPFRYAEIIGVPGELTADMIEQVVTHYPFDESESSFVSSDQTLNELWDICKYSMKATSFCGVFVDGDRERIPYEADAYINQLGWYAAVSDMTLPRYSNEYLCQHPTWPTEWQLHVPMMFHADYMYSGETSSIEMFYDEVKAKTLYQLAREDGLISTTDGRFTPEVAEAIGIDNIRDIVDWPKFERDGYELLPYNTVVNAFHYEAMRKMIEMSAALGKEDDVAFFTERCEQVYDSFNETFFDETTGLYIDGEGSSHSAQHANLFALAFDLVPEERKPKVVAFVKSKEMAVSVYAAQYLLEALYKCGEAEHAHHLMTNDSDRSWPHMWRNIGSTVTLEAWDIKYKPNLDWNHAWGAAPMNIIPRYMLGVQPLEPGFAKVSIAPQLGALESVATTVPTVKGPISIEAKQSDDGFSLTFEIPDDVLAEISIPASENATLTVDGVVVVEEPVYQDGTFVIENVGPGEHQILSSVGRSSR